MSYIESHTFPSGLTIDYESDPVTEYIEDRDSIKTQEQLTAFQEKWRYLFPEIVNKKLKAETLIYLLQNKEEQIKHKEYLNILIPSLLIRMIIASKKFKVSTGLIILQLWNHGQFIQMNDGTWVLKKCK